MPWTTRVKTWAASEQIASAHLNEIQDKGIEVSSEEQAAEADLYVEHATDGTHKKMTVLTTVAGVIIDIKANSGDAEVKKIRLRDSADAEVFNIDEDGDVTFNSAKHRTNQSVSRPVSAAAFVPTDTAWTWSPPSGGSDSGYLQTTTTSVGHYLLWQVPTPTPDGTMDLQVKIDAGTATGTMRARLWRRTVAGSGNPTQILADTDWVGADGRAEKTINGTPYVLVAGEAYFVELFFSTAPTSGTAKLYGGTMLFTKATDPAKMY